MLDRAFAVFRCLSIWGICLLKKLVKLPRRLSVEGIETISVLRKVMLTCLPT
jgi:hypothetical protein